MKRINPLFEVQAFTSAHSNVAPRSPITGDPMVKAMCADTPCWVDLPSRVVLPIVID